MKTAKRMFLTVLLLCMIEPAAAQDFYGDDCTDDCSGHEAGYEWAEENGIDDPDDCSGNSQSFVEGCESWVEENGGSHDDECENLDEDLDEEEWEEYDC